ncbi:hypothetical protein Lser_V15G40318 [Lactuca serriola]
MKLKATKSKLQDLKSNMAILGREAASAMAAVEGQQQKMTLPRLISMIESERAYHQKVVQILDQLEGESVNDVVTGGVAWVPSSNPTSPLPMLFRGDETESKFQEEHKNST